LFSPALSRTGPSGSWDWGALQTLALREARRYLDPDRALDAAQEAALRAWRRAGTCSGEPAPWIATIARREALRIATRRGEDGLPETYGPDADRGPAGAAGERLDMAAALATLPREQQQAVFLRYWADKTEAEIAAALRTPVGTIKVRLHRARATLAHELCSYAHQQ